MGQPGIPITELSLFEGLGTLEKQRTPLRTFMRGVLERFLPANLMAFGALAAGLTLFPSATGMTLSLAQLMILGLEIGGLTAGFAIGLAMVSRWVNPSVEVDGVRSTLAGFVAPLYLVPISLLTQGAGHAEIALACVLTGMLVGMTVLLPFAGTRTAEGDDFYSEAERLT